MNGPELARFLLDDAAHQVEKVIEGIPEELADEKVNDHCMSPRDTMIHLLDCGQAFFAHIEGNEYAWGSYQPADPSLTAMLAAYRAMRADIKHRLAEAGDNDNGLRAVSMYVFAHEFYHVGQLATFRLTFTPTWDPYSIYPQS